MKKGDILSVILLNCPEFNVVFFGANMAGVIVSPLNPSYTAEEIAALLDVGQASYVVTEGQILNKVVEALKLSKTSIKVVIPAHTLPEQLREHADQGLTFLDFGDLVCNGRIKWKQPKMDPQPTMLHLVPPMLNFLLNYPGIKSEDFASVRQFFCGAAPVPRNLVLALNSKFNLSKSYFAEGYGLTETSPVTHITPPFAPKYGSCGGPLPNTEAIVRDVETGESLPANQPGEICVRGPQVAPAELENLLLKHPNIADCAVIGIPDEDMGEKPRAYVVPRGQITEDEVARYVQEHLSEYKFLTGGVELVESIPKSTTGKLLRRQLKDEYLKRLKDQME
ncbi:unnamed protein product [Cyprideis torosa]|uniref:Uncharacterized protein n=1 Tax=Cyprideis torosa TaxID=163714 RepID=A0A7R8WCU9_9CRUS|nr:unnamed protein product [Cyprideis torosa]CAG0888315.1 unnamed protein product [Cyprideis torosa]